MTRSYSGPGDRTTRREFIAAAAGAALLLPRVALGQAKAPAVVGILWPSTEQLDAPYLAALRDGLRDAGYNGGENLTLAMRYANGIFADFPMLAAELAALAPGVIITTTDNAISAVRTVAPRIPLAALLTSDPVASGYAKSLGHPGGMVTGVSTNPDVAAVGKRLALIKEILPGLKHVALVYNPDFPSEAETMNAAKSAASSLQLDLLLCPVHVESDIAAAFSTGVGAGAEAFVVGGSEQSFFAEVARQALRFRRPAIAVTPDYVRAGLLMSYGVDFLDLWRQLPSYAARILAGTKPGDLPIAQPTKYYLALNLKTARELGLTFPSGILASADQVIE